ncbi:hypothetical protein RUM44_009485 [Polyplax serrata]|uniref:Uncharacterized protein n=1 Tax=Polyplax serrata TaxID=468196 RepID=A0ABR1AUA5_POLSC
MGNEWADEHVVPAVRKWMKNTFGKGGKDNTEYVTSGIRFRRRDKRNAREEIPVGQKHIKSEVDESELPNDG